MTDKPERRHKLIAVVEADTVQDLADRLENMARDIARGELTQGVSGGGTSGAIYSYKVNPEQTHDAYFKQIEEHLRERDAKAGR